MRQPSYFIMERTDKINSDITLTQNVSGLTYGTDALLLSAFVGGKRGGRAAELGTGTGVISLLVSARSKFSRIYAYEVQGDYAELARKNVSANGFERVISVINKDIRQAAVADVEKEVDAVFANPPYMRCDTGFRNDDDGKYAARHEVFGGIADFCECARLLLKNGGSFYTVWHPDRFSDLVCALEAASLSLKRAVTVYNDPDHSPCLILTEAKKGAGKGTFFTRPFFIKDGDKQTDEMNFICENGVFDERYRKK